jgi:hypothetical protein
VIFRGFILIRSHHNTTQKAGRNNQASTPIQTRSTQKHATILFPRKRHNRKPSDPKKGWGCPECQMDNHTRDNCFKRNASNRQQLTSNLNHQQSTSNSNQWHVAREHERSRWKRSSWFSCVSGSGVFSTQNAAAQSSTGTKKCSLSSNIANINVETFSEKQAWSVKHWRSRWSRWWCRAHLRWQSQSQLWFR